MIDTNMNTNTNTNINNSSPLIRAKKLTDTYNGNNNNVDLIKPNEEKIWIAIKYVNSILRVIGNNQPNVIFDKKYWKEVKYELEKMRLYS